MKTFGKKGKYKIHLINNMGNVTECHYFTNEKAFNNMIYSLHDDQLFKACISDALYCWHYKVA
jgi:hypothetical protein